MNFHRFAIVPLMALAFATNSHAQGETRAGVEAEGQRAVKAGQVPVGEIGKTASELKAAKAASASSTTRAEVRAETAAAKKAGTIPSGDLDQTRAATSRRPASASSSAVTREQVKAELKAAERSGDTEVGDLGKTQAEKDPARYAGAPEKAPKLKLKKVDLTRYHKRKAASAAADATSQ